GFGAAGCGSSTPSAPSTITIFTVPLLPSNEVPPVTNAESVGRGTAVITIDSAKNTVDFSVSVKNFPAGTAVNIAHIHGPNAPGGTPASAPDRSGGRADGPGGRAHHRRGDRPRGAAARAAMGGRAAGPRPRARPVVRRPP